MKALVIAHGHPDFSIGGAELAAYNLFVSLSGRREIKSASFLARTDLASIPMGGISYRRENEYLWRQDIGSWFRLECANVNSLGASFKEFLEEKRPDIVFVHHYANIGIEMLRSIRDTLPSAVVVLTLHEYLAICLRNGQMVKNGSKKLCFRETIEDCSRCFPEYSSNDFWLRKHYIQKHFEFVDAFISPSEFLRQRYIAWGIPEESIFVVENGQPKFEHVSDSDSSRLGGSRFGYFGQITEYKGVDVLLQALHLVKPEIRRKIVVEVHGANLEVQGKWFQELIEKLRTPLIAEGSVRWVGSYEPHELARRMSKVDWVVVPSIWWENSPMVIQEAFCSRRPVICSNIGGMAEKVEHGVTGLHFEARSPVDLADTITTAATTPGIWDRLTSNITQPLSYQQCADAYLAIATGLGAQRQVA